MDDTSGGRWRVVYYAGQSGWLEWGTFPTCKAANKVAQDLSESSCRSIDVRVLRVEEELHA